MSRHKKDRDRGSSATLAETIAAIRKAHHMTTTELALTLRVSQSMISRYESGKRVPRADVLQRLLRLAEGVEKNPLLEQLSIIRGRPITEKEAIRQADLMAAEEDTLKRELQIMEAPRPNLARFAYLAPTILHAQKEIDESVNTVLELWLAHEPSDPIVRQCFSEAAQYLRLLLGAKVVLRGGPLKGKYRVILPRVDFGDGLVHEYGDIVELDLETAKQYCLGLVSAEDVDSAEKKKQA